MLVKDCMTRHPIMISGDTLAAEAQKIMAENKVRHLPVVGDGKRLEGLITRQTLSLQPDTLGSVNVWEISRYLTQLRAKNVMLKMKNVRTTTSDVAVERAARIMSENRVGCLPVVEDHDVVIGIVSEVDVLNALQEMLGLPSAGVRATVRMPNGKGEFAKLTAVLGQHNIGVMGIGTFPAPRHEGYYDTVLKMPNIDLAQAKEILSQIPDQELIDIRDVV